MHYWSPYHILPKDLLKDTFPDKGIIRKAKKRLLAEFDLQDTPTILVNVKELDKNAVLQLFEQFENDRTNKFHATIYKETELLQFLEHGNPSIFRKKDAVTLLLLQPDLAKFVEPYFAEQYNHLLNKAIKERHLLRVQELCKDTSYMSGHFEEACFQKSYRHLKLKRLELKNYAEKAIDERSEDAVILDFFRKDMVTILNTLPSYFDHVIDQYAEQTVDLAINLHNYHRRTDLATYTLRQGLVLKTSEETTRKIMHVLDQIAKNTKVIKPEKLEYKPNRTWFWKIFRWVILLTSLGSIAYAIFVST